MDAERAAAAPTTEALRAVETAVHVAVGNAVRVFGGVLLAIALGLGLAILLRVFVSTAGPLELYVGALALSLLGCGVFCLAAGRDLQLGRDPF